jgi:valyl-tRNA synthetase
MSKKYNPKISEPKWQSFWEENNINKFDYFNLDNIYSIDTPPPTISGKLHIGHIFSYTQAEVIARFKRMQGFNVFYPFGFDDNGLPTERLVEKEIVKKATELPRKEFIEKCLEITSKYRTEFKNLWKSIGISADWSLEYSTISDYVRKQSQKSFLELYKKNYIERRNSPALWDTEFQTSVAQAEIEDKELESYFHDIKFTLEDGSSLIISTTRPELLPACTSVFVNPNDNRYKHFIGKKVKTPLNVEVEILADEKVDINKGSGAVMCCTYGDETDLYWVKTYNLKEKIIVSKDGRIKDTEIEEINGLKIKKAREVIVEKLREIGALVSSKPIIHTVGVYERSGIPIEIIPVPQWFIKTLEIKDKLLKSAEKINWYPSYMKQRYIDWVENLKWDWCISRQRFFGVSIPVWYSKKTGEIILPDESQLPVDPIFDKPKILPKGHTYDDIIPETDVLDTWATSSITPEINAHWKENHFLSDKLLPMSLRPQAHDIIRTWALYTIIKSELHHNNIPWKNIMISGHVLFKKGEKISKSKGQAMLTPEELINKYSADAVRFWSCRASLGKDVQFDENEIQNGRKLITKLYNACNFVFMNLNDFNHNTEEINLELTDKWILYRTQDTVDKMNFYLEKFEFGIAMSEFEKFFWSDFCDNYLELVKDRIYKPEKYGYNKKIAGQYTLYKTMNTIIKLLAPYLPHITEELYQEYFRKNENVISIHKTKYPINIFSDNSNKEYIYKGMNNTLQIIEMVRKFKTENKISMSKEIEILNIKANKDILQFLNQIKDDILGVTRSKKVNFLENYDLDVEIIL